MTLRRFDGAVVLITGAAGGLGREAARLFAGEGARLVVSDLETRMLEDLVQDVRESGCSAEALPGDVAEESTAAGLVARAISAFGRLDVAVNAAGAAHAFGKLVDLDGATLERMLAVNLVGVFYALKHQIPAMERSFHQTGRTGAILNVASVAGLVGAPLLSAYAAAKHGVVGLTRSAAAETARRGVRINALCPAFTNTPMVTNLLQAMQGEPAEATARLVGAIPMRRLAEPEEIAQAMLWICSPENGFMTGQALALDGGLTAI